MEVVMQTTGTRNLAIGLAIGEIFKQIKKPSGKNEATGSYDYDQKWLISPSHGNVGEIENYFAQQILIEKNYGLFVHALNDLIEDANTAEIIDSALQKQIRAAIDAFTVYNFIPHANILFNQQSVTSELSEDVINYSSEHNLQSYLDITIDLIDEFFTSLESSYIEVENDPEFEDEWLLINIAIRGDINSVVEQYDLFISEYVKMIPLPERNKIRLSYDII